MSSFREYAARALGQPSVDSTDDEEWASLSREIQLRGAQWSNGDCANFVPDDWINRVLALGDTDEGALGYLKRAMRTRVTMQHALYFAKLEDASRAVRQAAALDANVQSNSLRAVRSNAPSCAPAAAQMAA